VKQIGVTEWRSRLGELRQGTEVFVVLYRHRPAAILVPVPPTYWENVTPFLQALLQLRDRQLESLNPETTHPWIELGTGNPTSINFEEARRGTAMLFGFLAQNTPVILTFYTYANAIMLPVPLDLPHETLESIYRDVQAHIRASR
jgi:hypothetical protein